MNKFVAVLIFCQIASIQSASAFADEYSDCRVPCETEYAVCANQPAAPDPEAQTAHNESCHARMQSCYAACESLNPATKPTSLDVPSQTTN